MITENQIYPQGEYDNLKTVKGIEFTPREVDIIACVLNGRTAQKTIASFLTTPSRTVAARTVETHLRNITRKIGCGSQIGIIDFIEKSDKRSSVCKHYEYLQAQNEFEKRLISLRKRLPSKPCVIYGYTQKIDWMQTLLSHLEAAGVKIIIKGEENSPTMESFQSSPHTLYFIPQNLTEQSEISKYIQNAQVNPKNFTFLTLGNTTNHIPAAFPKVGIINIRDQENYYAVVFKLLQRIIPTIDLSQMISDFKESTGFSNIEFPKSSLFSQEVTFSFFRLVDLLKNKKQCIIPLITVSASFLYLVDWIFKEDKIDKVSYPGKTSIRSDLIVPLEETLLQRFHLVAQLEEKLKSKQGIKAVALVGVGGAGKTTLARNYAQRQKIPFVWEINAESRTSLVNAFEKVACSLCRNEEDKKLLETLKSTKDTKEREEKILLFIKERLKRFSKWLLIYDNVEDISSIQDYIPSDTHAWGEGQVILTTKDHHIGQSSRVNYTIAVGELSSKEKVDLFFKIINQGSSQAHAMTTSALKRSKFREKNLPREEAEMFLTNIPSFPLDVSVAAYYLRSTHIPYQQYLAYLKQCDPVFDALQKDILINISNYNKTRYGVISLAINQLIRTHEDFGELMLLISLVGSKNIPRELLIACKAGPIVDQFIYCLKKYSLLTEESPPFSAIAHFSIHQSTQEVSLLYLSQKLALDKNREPLESAVYALEKYASQGVEKGDFSRMRLMLRHCEAFLNHPNLLSPHLIGVLTAQIGSVNFHLDRHREAKEFFEKTLLSLQPSTPKNIYRIAEATLHLGVCYRAIGNYERARLLLEQSLSFYQKRTDFHNPLKVAQILVYLCTVYRDLGKYEQAKEVLEKSLTVYKQHFPEGHKESSWVLCYLGAVHRELGFYKQAQDYLNQSIIAYKQHPDKLTQQLFILIASGILCKEVGDYERAKKLLEESLDFYNLHFSEGGHEGSYLGHLLLQLGDTYRYLGRYKKAEELLEKSINLHEKYFPEKKYVFGRSVAYLGAVHRLQGNFEKSRGLLTKALAIYEDHYGKHHIETGRVIAMLAQLSLSEGDLEKAEMLLNKAFEMFEQSKHPDIYIILESLAELYLKKMINKKTDEEGQQLKRKSLDHLVRAQEVAKTYLPNDSPHLTRIQSKIRAVCVSKSLS